MTGGMIAVTARGCGIFIAIWRVFSIGNLGAAGGKMLEFGSKRTQIESKGGETQIIDHPGVVGETRAQKLRELGESWFGVCEGEVGESVENGLESI